MEVEYFICERCKHEFHENQSDTHCTYQGSLEEPPEFVFKCPSCGANDDGNNTVIQIVYRNVCVCCEEVQVPVEGDACAECLTCAAEAYLDDQRGH